MKDNEGRAGAEIKVKRRTTWREKKGQNIQTAAETSDASQGSSGLVWFRLQLSDRLFLNQLSSQIQMAAKDGTSGKWEAMQGCRDAR